MPAPDQAADCLLSQPMNVLDALARFLSFAAWAVMKNSWESPQTAGASPIAGIGAIPKFVPAALRSLICQMPSQVMEFLPFLNARYCASMSTLVGLLPFLVCSTCQSRAFTPAGEANVALDPSVAIGSPPFCQSR